MLFNKQNKSHSGPLYTYDLAVHLQGNLYRFGQEERQKTPMESSCLFSAYHRLLLMPFSKV